MSITKNPNNFHQPVLLNEVLDVLNPQKGDRYLDLTAGYGGHARAVFSRTKNFKDSVLVDRDEQAILSLDEYQKSGTKLFNVDFVTAARELVKQNRQFDMILMDLGVSSPHLNNPSRGFSFSHDGPLDMRMDNRQDLTAEALVNRLEKSQLTDILRRYGEEFRTNRITDAMIRSRPLKTTGELAEVIVKAIGRQGKIHPATKTFQALRIAVNDELGQLEATLPLTLELLKPGGRIAVISFHSLEDRIVKSFLLDQTRSGWESKLQLLTKKPITAGNNELVSNPRARSAKLRAAVKINTKERG
jgi:16S rRNA (cytosine1402-N4)-methyltransferase